jgi:hypothetical protein
VSQLDNQIGYVDEVTYGTRVVPTRFLEFNSESLQRAQNNRASVGLRKGQKVARSDRQSQAMKGASGSVEHDLAFQGFGLLLKHLMGKAAVLSQPSVGTAPTAWKQLFTLGDGAGFALTTQVGRPGSAGTVHPWDYLGCKVASGSISQSLDDYARLALNLDAQNEKTDQTLATASYPATQTLLHDGMLTVTVNGTGFSSMDSSFTIDRQLNLSRYFQRSSTLKKEPLTQNLAVASGSLKGEFEDLTTAGLFQNGTIVAIVFDWVGAIIGGAVTYELKITLPACRLDGPKPATSGPGILDADTPFTVLYDGTNEPVTVEYVGTDTAS